MPRGEKKGYKRSNEKQRHLYLVLDDWSQGYSIRKINLSPEDILPPLVPADVVQGDAIFTGRYTLPSALFRFEAQRGEPKSIAGAFDNKILARPLCHGESLENRVLVCDVHTRTFILSSWPRQDVLNTIYIPMGGTLFALHGGSFDMLYPPPEYDDVNWKNFVGGCLELPKPTFQCELITSYAVHPDEHTIFVSSVEESGVPATFSFNTVEAMWRRHGPWQLPFTGCGYFVPDFRAWVGLSGDPNTFGHICSCAVVSNSVANQCPALKLSKEKLFSMVPAERHIGATLVYMGGERKFCLLEGIYNEADLDDRSTDSGKANPTDFDEAYEEYLDEMNETDSDETSVESTDEVNEELDQNRFLRLTTFSLQFDRVGDLTTGNSCRVWYYRVPLEVTDAFEGPRGILDVIIRSELYGLSK